MLTEDSVAGPRRGCRRFPSSISLYQNLLRLIESRSERLTKARYGWVVAGIVDGLWPILLEGVRSVHLIVCDGLVLREGYRSGTRFPFSPDTTGLGLTRSLFTVMYRPSSDSRMSSCESPAPSLLRGLSGDLRSLEKEPSGTLLERGLLI